MLTTQGRIYRLEALVQVAAKSINTDLDSERSAAELARLIAWHQAALEELEELQEALENGK